MNATGENKTWVSRRLIKEIAELPVVQSLNEFIADNMGELFAESESGPDSTDKGDWYEFLGTTCDVMDRWTFSTKGRSDVPSNGRSREGFDRQEERKGHNGRIRAVYLCVVADVLAPLQRIADSRGVPLAPLAIRPSKRTTPSIAIRPSKRTKP